MYKLEYRFPPNVLISVRIIDTHDGDDVLFIKSGEGAEALEIGTDSRFIIEIEPAEEDARWQIEIRPLGLPSGYRPVSD
jgi:hypothetical protein